MKNLVFKELKLAVHWFYYVLPIMLACLMFIPQWIYTFVFMYFFWITITQVYSGYNAKEDYSFNAMLPVTRKEIVQSKLAIILILESIHLLVGVVFGFIHNSLYGSFNFFMDINLAFFGVIMVMYALFNIIFLPLYFKSAYYFGKPVIYGVIATLIYAFAFEFGAFKFQFMRDIFEGSLISQGIVMLVAIIMTVCLTIITLKKSILNYENIA